ncbi:MAG TPA: FlgD immunoglobulin-like domain containing protein, partial [bacterium]|nr:FlgD immunoglobulin-like domain containing protein [bacterium]
TVTVHTSAETTPVTSPSYSITASSTTVTSGSVTPNPSVENVAAAYTIAFSVGSGGRLTTSSTVSIKFPVGTTVPAGSISGVTLNNTSATASGSGQVVTINVPLEVSNSGAVSINFSSGSGLVNPNAGTYKDSIKTSSENTYVATASYGTTSSAGLSISAVTLGNNIANATSAYTIDFVLSATGALSTSDSVVMIFDSSTVFPSSIANNAITISAGGFSDYVTGSTVSKQTASGQTRLAMRMPVSAANSASVSVQIALSTNIQNPAVSGNYQLSVKTVNSGGATIDNAQASNSYNIAAATTTVSSSSVALSNTTAAQTNVSYTLGFTLGSYGRMLSGSSVFKVKFPSGTGYGTLTGTVNGTSASTPTRSGDTVSVILPSTVSLSNSASVTLVIGGITNPANGSYTISLATSVEASYVVSQSFTIGGTAVTISSVTLGNSGVNQTSAYTINCTGVSNLNTGDIVRVTFPEGTTVPSSIAAANVTFTGGTGQTVTSVATNTSSRFADITVGSNNKTFAAIVFASGAGIVNPSVPSTTFYKVNVVTTTNTQPATSPAYTVSSNTTSVTADTVVVTSNVVSQTNAIYEVYFTTGAFGKLAGGTSAGSDSIRIRFTSGGVVVPSSITAANVTINGVSSTGVRVVTSGANGEVKIEMPSGASVPASTQSKVTFSASAGLTNGGSAGSYQVQVATDAENTLSTKTSNMVFAASSALAVTQVTPSPSTINATAAYTIKFTTGSSGALAINDSILITFPSNTYLPGTISSSLITVNGSQLAASAVGSNNVLRIRNPVTINNVANVTIAISSSAGILNPTGVSTSYSLTVTTKTSGGTVVEGPTTSPQYTTTATSTTITTPSVTLSSSTPSASSNYTIAFNTGTNGRLRSTTDSVSIVFPSGSTVPASPTVTINTVSASAYGTGLKVTAAIPASVSIGNSGSASVVINGITNPTAGNYTLSAYTTVESGSITSPSYTINNAPLLTGVSLAFTPNTDTVNMAGGDSIYFTTGTGGALTSGSSTITVVFPNNTVIPASITASNVTVNSVAASVVATNSGTRTVTVTSPTNVNASTNVTLFFATACGIINPSVAGTYAVQVSTTPQPNLTTSSNYTVKAATTTVTNFTMTLTQSGTSDGPNEFGRYNYTFKTGLRGKLLSGTSTISLLLPYDATFTTGTPTVSTVTVNGTAAAALRLGLSTLNEDTLEVTVPASVTIGNQTSVTVIIDSTSGLRNASTASALTYKVFTSVETGVVGGDATLPVELAFFDVVQNGNKAVLKWRTESEINNAYWLVERAESNFIENEDDLQGKTSHLQYTRVAEITGQGTKNTSTDYILNDDKVEIGKTYVYRLMDVSYDGVLSIHQEKKIIIETPQVFDVFPNYPNPFNPSTLIRFQIPSESHVVVTIYNLLGQEVKELVNKDLPAGMHTMQWNGTNNRNSLVASGVYLYRVTATSLQNKSKYSRTHRMTLLK